MLLTPQAFRRALAVIVFIMLPSCSPRPQMLPAAPVHANGQLLWQIVHDRCVPGQLHSGNPAPCTEVSIADGIERGYVVLKDRNGASQYLVMPTRLISGIEDPRLVDRGATDYFTPAWQARQLVSQRLGKTLARADIGIAVNSIYGRSQDLMHLHVDCLRADVRQALRLALPSIDDHWGGQPLILDGHAYRATRIEGDNQVARNPFLLLSQGLNVRRNEMGAWTLVLAGADFGEGKTGFVLLAARADPARGYAASGEDLQDHSCADLSAGS